MAKEASLESMRVAIRKCEQAVAPMVGPTGWAARIQGLERRVSMLEGTRRPPAVAPAPAAAPQRPGTVLPSLAELESAAPAPSVEPSPIDLVQGMLANPEPLLAIGREMMSELVGELKSTIAAAVKEGLSGSKNGGSRTPAITGLTGALTPEDLAELGLDPAGGGSSVAFEQTKG